ncbi:MAG: AAC(3) family N-acetyltransferase, partial [Kiritimatiellia bacterium]|nr:AAC(3) family N-acetyltransferase [Kiritimatiellia bacterium]
KPGDLVIAHSSLSQFGKVQGGADTVIDALIEVIGYEGILTMPAFTETADSKKGPPFDPASSIAYTGIISNTFWQREGVLRNSQPTHSLAAWGRRAAEFLQSDNLSDTFDWNGPWGRLYRWNGKILVFGEIMDTTTYLHALEGWFLSYLDKAYARVKQGNNEKLVYIVNYPSGCRGGWYGLKRTSRHFQQLYSKGLYREVKIGAAAALAINVRDLTREIHSLFKEDPTVLLHKSGCFACAERRARLVGWKIPETLPDNTKF